MIVVVVGLIQSQSDRCKSCYTLFSVPVERVYLPVLDRRSNLLIVWFVMLLVGSLFCFVFDAIVCQPCESYVASPLRLSFQYVWLRCISSAVGCTSCVESCPCDPPCLIDGHSLGSRRKLLPKDLFLWVVVLEKKKKIERVLKQQSLLCHNLLCHPPSPPPPPSTPKHPQAPRVHQLLPPTPTISYLL